VNVSFSGRPARFDLQSNQIVLLDPIVLNGLASALVDIGVAPVNQQPEMLQALAERGPLRTGLHEVAGFRPGLYQVDRHSFQAAEGESDPGAFDVDSGAVVLVDLSLLGPVAQVVTWDRYDELLRAPLDDYSLLDKINAELGRPGFAVIGAEAASPFSGDGTFRLAADQPRPAL